MEIDVARVQRYLLQKFWPPIAASATAPGRSRCNPLPALRHGLFVRLIWHLDVAIWLQSHAARHQSARTHPKGGGLRSSPAPENPA